LNFCIILTRQFPKTGKFCLKDKEQLQNTKVILLFKLILRDFIEKKRVFRISFEDFINEIPSEKLFSALSAFRVVLWI